MVTKKDAPAKEKIKTGYGEAQAKLDKVGVEYICNEILNGQTLTSLAAELKVDRASIYNWVNASPPRLARVRETRIAASAAWDEMAENEIRNAKDTFELTKARELAHHFRWRAKCIAPKDYGDRKEEESNNSDVTVHGGLPD